MAGLARRCDSRVPFWGVIYPRAYRQSQLILRRKAQSSLVYLSSIPLRCIGPYGILFPISSQKYHCIHCESLLPCKRALPPNTMLTRVHTSSLLQLGCSVTRLTQTCKRYTHSLDRITSLRCGVRGWAIRGVRPEAREIKFLSWRDSGSCKFCCSLQFPVMVPRLPS